MTEFEFAFQVASLPDKEQVAFFERLKDFFTEEEIKAIRTYVSMVQLYKNPAKYEALKDAACEAFCEKFFGQTCERRKHIEEPRAPYMTSINDFPL